MNGSRIADEFLAEEMGVDYDVHTSEPILLTREDFEVDKFEYDEDKKMKNKKLTNVYALIYGEVGFLGTKIYCFANSRSEAVSKVEKYIKDNNIFKDSYYCVCVSENLFLLD